VRVREEVRDDDRVKAEAVPRRARRRERGTLGTQARAPGSQNRDLRRRTG
jgi:hypothetical protein